MTCNNSSLVYVWMSEEIYFTILLSALTLVGENFGGFSGQLAIHQNFICQMLASSNIELALM